MGIGLIGSTSAATASVVGSSGAASAGIGVGCAAALRPPRFAGAGTGGIAAASCTTSADVAGSVTGWGAAAEVFLARGAGALAAALLAVLFAARVAFGSVWAAAVFAPRLDGVVLVMSVPFLSVTGTASVFFVFGMYVPGHSGRARGGKLV
ncbi:hypothetical protein AUC44_11730 [Deinococcus actinosclerus]|uniref:Uncharacterized protein n=1 Tax=Deinococcus actinosclerus TaxID=1768108 RepID=A0ABM5X6R1_9DEIO|nr:hypothetical protein AUC44_11730 [Deinococcus actinosclerus]